MTSELMDLYQEVILDHNKNPRNRGSVADAQHVAEGHNPLCGDRVKVYVRTEGDRIAEVRFEGTGCAISTASASLMTESVRRKTLAEVEGLHREFHRLLTGDPSERAEAVPQLGKLAVFSGVREFPVRVKCATLAWHTLRAALHGEAEPVSTE